MNTTLENVNALARLESTSRLERDNGAILPGQVCLANESRFNSSFFSEPAPMYCPVWPAVLCGWFGSGSVSRKAL